MGNLGEEKPMKKLVIEVDGDEYVFEGGGGGQPGPNTVGTNEIIDDSVQMEDLNSSVKDAMVTDKDRVTQEQIDNFEV